MGIWGTGLYQDDISADVKDFYKEQLRMQKSTIDIKSELLSKYEDVLDDPYDASVFWFALADTQWEFGRLEGSVKEKALISATACKENFHSEDISLQVEYRRCVRLQNKKRYLRAFRKNFSNSKGR